MDQKRLVHGFATCGPIGHLPVAPGTWGSLVASILVFFLFPYLNFYLRIILLFLIFILGSLAASEAEKHYKIKDPGQVVIDEVLGQFIVFAAFNNLQLLEIAIGFFIFRTLDIFKPWPVKPSEEWLPAGYGIMLDDVLAGIYGGIFLGFVRIIF